MVTGRRLVILVVLGGLLAGAGYWWFSQLWQQDQTPLVPTPVAEAEVCGMPAADTVSAERTIKLTEGPFSERLTEGQTVRWVNQTDHPIEVSSESLDGGRTCAGFDQQTLAPGDVAQFTFLLAGTWHFLVNQQYQGVIVAVAE